MHVCVLVCFLNLSLYFLIWFRSRYFICADAMQVTLVKPKSTETLEDEHSCSDGFIIDTTPPLVGSVQIGSGSIQHDNTQLEIHWDGFRDLDELGAEITHESGISQYVIEIGNALIYFWSY